MHVGGAIHTHRPRAVPVLRTVALDGDHAADLVARILERVPDDLIQQLG
jgi:hypothetical protein